MSIEASSLTKSPSRGLQLVIDLVLVLAFIAIGLRSHSELLSEILPTAAPFLLAAMVSHLLLMFISGRRVLALPVQGLFVWLVTLVLGLLLRITLGDTAALAFMLVSAVTLAVFLLGWRLIYSLAKRKK